MSARDRYATETAYQRNLASAREAKRRRTGTCKVCGGVTRYNGHAVVVSEICASCNGRRAGVASRGTGRRWQEIHAALSGGPKRFMELANELGMDNNNMSQWVNKGLEYGYMRRVSYGVYELTQAGWELGQ